MNKKLLINTKHLFLMFLAICPSAFCQPFQVGHTTINFIDSSRNNRNIATEIYYPSDVAGDDVPLTSNTASQFPPIIFGHGFVMGWDAYENIWSAVVPQGFIMAFPKTEGGILPSHSEYGKDLAFVVSKIHDLGLQASTIFYNRVGLNDAVMGHSMGGGAAFLAASQNNNIKALVVLSPAETNPSAITAAASIDIPALIFAGGNDCVTPPSANQLPMYNALQSDCKTYISIHGGSHCQMADPNFLCGIGEATCSPSPAINRETQHQIINTYLIDWLKSTLKDDCVSGNNFNNQIAADTSIDVQKNCQQCNGLGNVAVKLAEFGIYPNPFIDVLHIDSNDDSKKSLVVYDSQMRQIYKHEFSPTTDVTTEAFCAGMYIYTISENEKILKTGKLVKN